MTRSPSFAGLVIAIIAALSFGMSGAFAKPLLDAGWTAGAAVTMRAFVGALALAPLAIIAMRGRWSLLWKVRSRVLAMGLIGVAGTQLAYFAAIERIPVGTAILIEYMAPLLLVAVVWMRSGVVPKLVVLVGSAFALVGLALVVSPSGEGSFDLLGLVFAMAAMVGAAGYYVIAARDDDGLPPIALAASGLVVGGVALALLGATGLLPFRATFGEVQLFDSQVSWLVPTLVVGIIATAVAYATSITATQLLGSRVASFVGLLEVVAATFYAWLLLSEQLTVPQMIGGLLILIGIGFVRSERTAALLPLVDIESEYAPTA